MQTGGKGVGQGGSTFICIMCWKNGIFFVFKDELRASLFGCLMDHSHHGWILGPEAQDFPLKKKKEKKNHINGQRGQPESSWKG